MRSRIVWSVHFVDHDIGVQYSVWEFSNVCVIFFAKPTSSLPGYGLRWRLVRATLTYKFIHIWVPCFTDGPQCIVHARVDCELNYHTGIEIKFLHRT